MPLMISAQSLEKIESDALIMGIEKGSSLGRYFPNAEPEFKELLDRLVAEKEVNGEQEEITIVHTFEKIKSKRLVIVGLGNAAQFNLDRLRKSVAIAGRKLRQIHCKRIAISLDTIPVSFSREDIACALMEGFFMGLYQFPKISGQKTQEEKIDQIIFCCSRTAQHNSLSHAIYIGSVLADVTNFARTIANSPGNFMTPNMMAQEALALAKQYNLNCRIFDEEDMKKMGMNLVLAVSQGSENPPRMIVLEYNGNGGYSKPVALVGKGVTFDSGGISLKPGKDMHKMKADRTGGAIAMAVIKALAMMNAQMHLVAVIPCVENMPSGKAYKPGDVFTSYSGKSVEILNTDAEGRLILADAISYVQKDLKMNRIIDVATLTGGALSALGPKIIAAFSNDDSLYKLFEEGCWHSGEYCWRMPLYMEYQDMLKSDVADLKNLSYQPPSTIEGALFLQSFVKKDTKWMHLDIASVDYTDSPSGYVTKGSTGIGIRSLLRMLMHLSEQDLYEHPPYQALQYGKLWSEYRLEYC
ncbi:MAG: leucyl aminopeptidase [Candidatus Brocadiae bacterium]|nr:leucyl aminopeptidase [Candidatus Brocadiia bacterium]